VPFLKLTVAELVNGVPFTSKAVPAALGGVVQTGTPRMEIVLTKSPLGQVMDSMPPRVAGPGTGKLVISN
jgi:hypothetical protein